MWLAVSPARRFSYLCFCPQLQLEKEKQAYDFEGMESQLDKALGQAARLQKEREAVQLEADRLRDKYDKVQVSSDLLIFPTHIQ